LRSGKTNIKILLLKKIIEGLKESLGLCLLGFKNFHCAQKTLVGIELMAMLNKGQMAEEFAGDLSVVM